MGRKIPAKKHRGVKDPLEQQARRLQSLKGKINAPPADPDDQPVPRSLQRLFAPRAHLRPATRNRATHTDRGSGNPVSRLRRVAGESARAFSRRITDATRALHAAAPLHYPVEEEEGEEEDRKDARMRVLRERRTRKQRRLAPVPDAPPALSRTQKLALKKKAKKQKAIERASDRPEATMERVPFGEVAHAPPTLRPPRNAVSRGRGGLLLAALLQGGGDSGGESGAEARRRERAREAAVAAYRALKASRAATTHSANKKHPTAKLNIVSL